MDLWKPALWILLLIAIIVTNVSLNNYIIRDQTHSGTNIVLFSRNRSNEQLIIKGETARLWADSTKPFLLKKGQTTHRGKAAQDDENTINRNGSFTLQDVAIHEGEWLIESENTIRIVIHADTPLTVTSALSNDTKTFLRGVLIILTSIGLGALTIIAQVLISDHQRSKKPPNPPGSHYHVGF